MAWAVYSLYVITKFTATINHIDVKVVCVVKEQKDGYQRGKPQSMWLLRRPPLESSKRRPPALN